MWIISIVHSKKNELNALLYEILFRIDWQIDVCVCTRSWNAFFNTLFRMHFFPFTAK